MPAIFKIRKSDFPEISGKGVYCLIFSNTYCTIDAGRLKDLEFRHGYHIYVGSALGSGGLKRLKRHVMLSLTKDKKPRWHVDYLSVSSLFELTDVAYVFTDRNIECSLAEKINSVSTGSIRNFGSGDCKCSSHLFYSEEYPLVKIENAFSEMKVNCNSVHFS